MKETIFGKMVGKCPEALIQIGSKINYCLLDSGSEISTVTESFFNENLKPLDKEVDDISGWMTIRAANGLEIPFVGYIETDITLMGQTFPNLGVLVVKDPTAYSTLQRKKHLPVLLGSNILRRINDQLTSDNADKFAQTEEGREWMRVLSLYGKVDVNNVQCDRSEAKGYLRALRGNPVKIPARSVKSVKGTGKIKGGKYCAMVERIQAVDAALPSD